MLTKTLESNITRGLVFMKTVSLTPSGKKQLSFHCKESNVDYDIFYRNRCISL